MKRRNFDERVQLIWLGKPSTQTKIEKPEEDSSQAYKEIVSNSLALADKIRVYDSISLLCLVSILNKLASAPKKGTANMSSPVYVEFITALALSKSFSTRPQPQIKDGLGILDETFKLFLQSQHYCYLRTHNQQTGNSGGSPEISPRAHYMVVRGETNHSNFIESSRILFGQHDRFIRAKHGFTTDQAIKYITLIMNLINQRFAKEKEHLDKIFIRYFENRDFKEAKEIAEQKGLLSELGKPVDLAKRIFYCTNEELNALVEDEEKGSFDRFIEWISTTVRDIKNDIWTPLDLYPLQDKPVVKIDNGFLFHCCDYLGRSFYYSLDKELMSDLTYQNKYSKARAKYLETEAIKTFKKMFPSCEVFSDLYYKVLEDGKLQTCQLDALVKHDNNVFVIECATHPVTKSAKDGLIDPITHDIEQSVERTLRQAKRAKTFMTQQDIAEFTTSNKSKVTIETKKVSNYFLVSITGDSFDPFVCDSSALSNMGFTSDNEIPWTVYIENLKLISDFIDMPSQFVHYLKKRGSLKQRIIASDEIDYFGCYLACNLDIPMPPGERIDTTLIVDASSDFNRYFEYKRGMRPRVPRPGQYLPKHFKSLLKTFERIHLPGYTDVCCLLLDMSFDQRRNLDKNIASSISRWKANQSKCKDISFIDVESQYGFTYFCFSSKELYGMGPIEFLPEFCLTKMHEHGLTRWLGISKDQAFRSPVASCFFCGGQTKDKNEGEKAIRMQKP